MGTRISGLLFVLLISIYCGTRTSPVLMGHVPPDEDWALAAYDVVDEIAPLVGHDAARKAVSGSYVHFIDIDVLDSGYAGETYVSWVNIATRGKSPFVLREIFKHEMGHVILNYVGISREKQHGWLIKNNLSFR